MNPEIDSLRIIAELIDTNSEQVRNVLISEQEKFLELISYDTVFTVVTTISIFIFGFLINGLVKYNQRKKEQKQIKLYFKTFLDRIVDDYLGKLSKLYKDFYQTTDINSGIPSSPPKVLSGDFERIKSINGEKIFHSIKEKESLSRIFNQIDFIEKLILEITEYHQHIRTVSDSLRNPMQEMLNKYFDTLSKYTEYVRINNPTYPRCQDFYSLVNDSLGLYHQGLSKSRQISKVYYEIIRPIQNAVVNSEIFRNDVIGFEIAEKGKDFSLKYTRLRMFTVDIKLSYRSFSGLINSAKLNLESERKKINWR